MKKILLLSFFLSGIYSQIFAQANIWYFGDYSGLKFNGTGSPTALNNSAMWTGEGSAVMTDKAGKLLFYTDGVSVWNSKHGKDVTGMKGHGSSTQTALIIPVPETTCKRYFIFTVGGVEDFGLGANVTLVEMTGDGTSGTSIKKIEGPTRMYSASVTEKLNGIKDGNGGYWVVNHEWQNNKYHSYHVTKTTTDITKLLATDVVTSIGKSQTGILTNGQGQLKFNRTGTKMAVTVAQDQFVEIYDFSLSTGKPSNVQLIQNDDPNFPSNKTIFSGSANLYGLEFSNSGNYLYVAEFFTGGSASVFQFDLSSGNLGTIRSSNVVLGTNSHSSRYPYGAMQMAVDGKIYIARSNRYFLGVIRKPESGGTSSDFVENGVTLLKECFNGLPTTIEVDLCCSINKPYLGRDTSMCSGEKLVLKDTTKNISEYLWSDFSNNSTLTVSKPGQYWVEIANGNCKARDTINVSLKKSPLVKLGRDTVFCDFSNLTLGAKLGGPTFLWSTAETTKTIKPRKIGSYWVQVDSMGCKASDTIVLTPANLPKPSLGRDTTACEGATITLTGFTAGAKNYTWSTGNQLPNQDVNVSGTYILNVSDNICTLADTVKVTFIPYPKVYLGRDTGFCGNFTLKLDAGNTGLSKIWSTFETTQTIMINNQFGPISVIVSNQGCKKSDEIIINKLPGPSVDLGPDSIYCSLPIAKVFNAQNPGMNYLWDNGSTAPSYAANGPGKYWLRVSDATGCVFSDTIELKDSSFSFAFGDDISICFGKSVVLKGLKKPYTNSWTGSVTSDSLIVNTGGLYKVIVSNGACQQADSIKVNIWPQIYLDLGPDTFICDALQETITLSGPPGFASYTWQPGGETQSSLDIKLPGVYSLKVTDENDCDVKDEIKVTVLCPISFWVPTAFNPGSAGVNGRFGVSYMGPPVEGFEMMIFNRWGELIYKSNDINGYWDGTYLGNPCQLGMYMCIINFKSIFLTEKKRTTYQGMFYLNR